MKPITSRKRSTFRKFYHSNLDEELSVSSDEGSLDIGYGEEEDDEEEIIRQASQRLTLNTKNDRISEIKRESRRHEGSHTMTGPKKAVTKRSKNSNTNKVSSVATSHVDIETVDGKVSLFLLILLDSGEESYQRREGSHCQKEVDELPILSSKY